MMNMIAIYMLSGTVFSAFIAGAKDRSVVLWALFGILAGPIAVALLMWLPSRRPALTPLHPSHAMHSIADEIDALDDMRQRGMISDDEFAQGKAQILAWPVTSPIPQALSPQRVIADGRRTWTSYQPATRVAFADLARRHGLVVSWRDDFPFEVVATYPVQPGLGLEFTLALERGAIYFWGEGWNLDNVEVGRPDKGMPPGFDHALDAFIEGAGRIVSRTAYGAPSPFWVSLQVQHEDRWQTIHRQAALPWPPFWRKCDIRNREAKHVAH